MKIKVGQLKIGYEYKWDDKSDCNPSFQVPMELLMLNWQALLENPDLPDEDWPVYHAWHKLLAERFGEIPTPDSKLERGKLWSWPHYSKYWKNLVRDILQSDLEFIPEKAPKGESPLVQISKEGGLYVCQGTKRTAFCRLHYGDNYEIDYKVSFVAPEWEQLCHDLFPKGKKELYHPIDHPYFEGWPVSQPCEDRWKMIEGYLGSNVKWSGKFIDFGCHSGWFCRKFQEKGMETYGIDNEKEPILMARFLGKGNGHYFKGDIINIFSTCDEDFKYAMLTSVLMHLFAHNSQERVISFLKKLSQQVRVLFVDCGFGSYQKHLPFNNKTMPRWISDRTDFKSFDLLGTGQRENRQLFAFVREP